jgi:hypothetical protein
MRDPDLYQSATEMKVTVQTFTWFVTPHELRRIADRLEEGTSNHLRKDQVPAEIVKGEYCELMISLKQEEVKIVAPEKPRSTCKAKVLGGSDDMKDRTEVVITKEQFMDYERVRKEGRFNMLDPNARMLSGLPQAEYSEIMWNYGEHADKWLKSKEATK